MILMRILALVPDAFGGRGGIAKYNRDLLTSLASFEETTEIVAIPRFLPEEPGNLPKKLTYITDGINSKVKYIKTIFQTVLKRPKFDLIICGHVNYLWVVILLKFLLKSRVILVMHGVDIWQPNKNSLNNLATKYIDAYFSVSELSKDRFLTWTKNPKAKGYLTPNSFDPGIFSPGEKPDYLIKRYGLEDKKVLMTLGRLDSFERYKGFDEVIELLPDLLLEVPNVKYLIVGDGNDRERLQKKVDALNLNEYVIFAGYIPENEKVDHYRVADVFVMPSRGEGFGIVFLEAMACGLPVIASKLDGGKEATLNGRLGVLVDPNKPEEIKRAVIKCLNQKEKKVPSGLEFFSFTEFENRIHKVLKDLIKNF